MTELVDVLTKVYVFVNRMKIQLALQDVEGSFGVLNSLSDYLVSIDVEAQKGQMDCTCISFGNDTVHPGVIMSDCPVHGVERLNANL